MTDHPDSSDRELITPRNSLPAGAALLAGPAEFRLPVSHLVFAGCLNQWGRNSYWQHGVWEVDIETVRTTSTCGSPVFSSGKWWVGFLREGAGGAVCDGREVRFSVPEGQEVLIYENQPRDESAWVLYRELAAARLVHAPAPVATPAHWHEWEYCTWVEQKVLAAGGYAHLVLDEKLVRQLAERVLRLGLPPGKFTIDAGWHESFPQGRLTDGYWRTDSSRFPDLPALCRWLKAQGFVPGLWFGLSCLPGDAPLRHERPDLFGSNEHAVKAEDGEERTQWSLAPGPATEAFLRDRLRPYVEMGFRKFKFDFCYGGRSRMIALMRTLHAAVRSLDPAVEIESHHPDFFFSRWLDSCRLNDVLIMPGWDWEGLTLAHMRVTRLCAPDRIMNLDHAGGNDQDVGEGDFLRHLEILDSVPETQARYAVGSLLPDRFSAKARERFRAFVQRHRGSPPS